MNICERHISYFEINRECNVIELNLIMLIDELISNYENLVHLYNDKFYI